MANNGNIPHHNGHNGNGGYGKHKIPGEILGFMGAEMIAEATWIGSAILTQMIPKKAMGVAVSALAKCIEPVLDPVENVVGKVCKLKECRPDPGTPRLQRAEGLARVLLTYIPGIVLSFEAKLLGRRWLNGEKDKKWNQMFTEERMIFLADEIPTFGALYVFNNQLAPVTDDVIHHAASILHKTTGMSEHKAHEMATAGCMWGIPNAIGILGASVAIAGKHLHAWPPKWMQRILGGKSDRPTP